MDERNATLPLNREKDEYPKSANYNLTSDITGDGVNQTVRAYMKNQSRALDNENGYSETRAPDDNMYLNYGDMVLSMKDGHLDCAADSPSEPDVGLPLPGDAVSSAHPGAGLGPGHRAAARRAHEHRALPAFIGHVGRYRHQCHAGHPDHGCRHHPLHGAGWNESRYLDRFYPGGGHAGRCLCGLWLHRDARRWRSHRDVRDRQCGRQNRLDWSQCSHVHQSLRHPLRS